MWKTKKKPVFFCAQAKIIILPFFGGIMIYVGAFSFTIWWKLCIQIACIPHPNCALILIQYKDKKGLVIYPIRFSLTKNKNKWMKKAVYIVYNWKFLCFFTFNGSKTNGTLTGKQCKFKTITISCNNLLWESSGIPAMQRIKRWNTNKKWWEQP